MPRPPSITDDQILDAARVVFLEKGIRATTAEVARRAGVAEGSLFNRFKTKDALFLAALEPTLGELTFLRRLAASPITIDVRAALVETGLATLEFFRKVLPLIMMTWSNRACGLPDHLKGPNPPPLRALGQLASFFAAQMRAGRMRRHDPEILGRVFLGSIQNYVFFEILLKEQDRQPMPAERYIRGLVQLLWTGAGPLDPDGTKPRQRKRKPVRQTETKTETKKPRRG